MTGPHVNGVILGEVLGVDRDASKQLKHKRFTRFMTNLVKDRISRNDLLRIAAYFQKPLEYFVLSGHQFAAIQGIKIHDIKQTESGTYLFINKEDHELLDQLFQRISGGDITNTYR